MLAAVFSVVVASCGGESSEPVSVSDPWIRATAPFANTAALYGRFHNDSSRDDVLVELTSERCQEMEIHQTVIENGVASMRAVEPNGLMIDAGQIVELAPGGVHVMCLGIDRSFDEGTEVTVTLSFAVAEDLDLQVPVRR